MGKQKKRIPSLRKRKKKKKEPYIVECLKLPQDVVMGMELATMCGDREITLRSFKGILSISRECIVVQARRHKIIICGQGLALKYYTLEETKITGCIQSIQYEER